jgi:hypothetical protein
MRLAAAPLVCLAEHVLREQLFRVKASKVAKAAKIAKATGAGSIARFAIHPRLKRAKGAKKTEGGRVINCKFTSCALPTHHGHANHYTEFTLTSRCHMMH